MRRVLNIKSVAQLRALLFDMETSLGLADLSHNERDVLYAINEVAAGQPKAARSEAIRNHPLAAAIVAAARDQGLALAKPEQFDSESGIGVRGEVDGHRLQLGNTTLLEDAGVATAALQTQAEAQRFLDLGARPSCVEVTGSIKFDLKIDAELLQRAVELRRQWQAEQRPVWIAASTHAGEDEIILAAHRQLLETQPDALLILVPRHPERFNSVHELCISEGLTTRRRSTAEAVQTGDQVLLGDTMGELLFLYALADIAFVGGSLVANGGHNLLEPAALGKPVLSGPHLFNFLEIAAQLREAGALSEVENAVQLADRVAMLLNEPSEIQRMSQAGLSVLKANQGALERLLEGLQRLL